MANRKSVKIPKDILKLARKEINSFDTQVEASEVMGIGRVVLINLLYRDTCAPETLEALNNYLEKVHS